MSGTNQKKLSVIRLAELRVKMHCVRFTKNTLPHIWNLQCPESVEKRIKTVTGQELHTVASSVKLHTLEQRRFW